MWNLTNRDADRLARLLDEAQLFVRELAGEQARRENAMRAIGERNLATYHDMHHEHALRVADELRDAVEHARTRQPWVQPSSRRDILKAAG